MTKSKRDNKNSIPIPKTIHLGLVIILFLFSFFSRQLIAQVYTINQGGSISTCSGTFYDDGGASGNYSIGKTFVQTFCPGTPGQCLQVKFTSFDLFQSGGNPFAWLYVYDGPDTNSAPLGVLTGNQLKTIASSTRSPNGCITFKFVTDASFPFGGAGWAGTISCVTCGPPPPPSVQDCIGAIPICQSVFSETNSYSGSGNIIDINTSKTTCNTAGETNSVWYKFTAQTSGNLAFLIQPQNNADDYDWGLYNLTSASCADIPNNSSLEVSCNSVGSPAGETGMSNPKGGATNTNGPNTGNPYNKELPIVAGETYYLVLLNASFSTNGYTLDFTTSQASIYDNIKPVMKQPSAITCGATSITLNFSENILCSSVQNADFTLTGPGGPYTITKVSSANCNTTNSSNTYVLDISPAINGSGNFTLCLTNTSSSVTDFCGNMADPVCFTFSPCSPAPPTVTTTNSSVCPGACNSITATGSGGTAPYTYSWNPGSGTGSNFNVCPASTTTYTVITTDNTGATASNTAIVTVLTSPTAVITGTTTICSGTSTTLTGSGGGTYAWNTGASTTSITVSPTSSTTYSLIATTNGCTGSAQVGVIVNSNPAPTISGITTICAGTGTTLTATGGGSYSWSTAATTASITVSPANTTTYTVVVTNNGCTGSTSVVVTVAANLIPIITGNTSICPGQSTTLSTSGGGTYAWDNGNTSVSITVSPSTNTSYSVTVTNGSCSGTASVQVTIVNNPSPVISGNMNVCPGTSTVLTASGGDTYVWDNGQSTTSITVSPSVQTTYTVTATTSAGGCTGQTTAVVSITPPPVPTIAGATAICNGGSTTLTATAGGTYSWNTGATTAAITVSPTVSTTYTVTVTTGCTATATIQVTVQANLTPTITGNNAICNGQSTTLSTSGGGTYSWSTTETTQSITVSPAIGTSTYSVTVTNGLCSGTAQYSVTVNSNPSPTITGNTAICSGQSTSLTANAGGTYSWNTGASTATISVSPISTALYTVTVTTNGCTGTATVQVTVNPTPNPSITGITNICSGQSTTLTSSTSGPYAWSTGETSNSITVSPVSTTTYSVSVTVNGCTGTAFQTVTVVPPVTASITGNNICVGENVILTASGGTTYQWNTGASTSAIQVSPTGTTSYTVIASVGSCSDTATYVVTVNPLPVPIASGDTTILYGQSTSLTSSGGGTYQWLPPDGLSCSDCPNPTATPTATMQYCVVIKNSAGCTDSSCVTVRVDLKCGFEGEIFVPNGFSPNGDGQNDVLYVRGVGITDINWVIFDRWGEKVFETSDPKQGWDGTYKGKQLDPAVFIYYFIATCITGDEIKQKGNVAIIK